MNHGKESPVASKNADYEEKNEVDDAESVALAPREYDHDNVGREANTTPRLQESSVLHTVSTPGVDSNVGMNHVRSQVNASDIESDREDGVLEEANIRPRLQEQDGIHLMNEESAIDDENLVLTVSLSDVVSDEEMDRVGLFSSQVNASDNESDREVDVLDGANVGLPHQEQDGINFVNEESALDGENLAMVDHSDVDSDEENDLEGVVVGEVYHNGEMQMLVMSIESLPAMDEL